ncbi:hypothetical protein AAFF_G00118910 [Aldrovandia affinis]|uniref:Uncharacterized protein n=1 Tax=Aldrovandia affinis TaxID=143900 RepID=A0AAD7WA35_9TELE|nr:hypothetical protein AAFF_G00118910 [Aldrovandia affinis]
MLHGDLATWRAGLSSRTHRLFDGESGPRQDTKPQEVRNSSAFPPLGTSDHNLIRLVPTYKPVVRRQPVTTRTVQLWSGEVEERLQDCLQITNWDLFTEDFGEDIEGLADCITLYIRTCEESIVLHKKVRCFPNNKPWINKNIKALLNRKKRAFMAKDREGVKSVQKELKGELRRAKKGYKEKIEGKLEDNSTREVWDGLKRITGQKQAGLDVGRGQDRCKRAEPVLQQI